ncbi:MAG: ATP-dependent Clp protease proteolytic subunit [bacterium]|nr:ATP-dependent Clp protease proteolytic subunit [bacterium]
MKKGIGQSGPQRPRPKFKIEKSDWIDNRHFWGINTDNFIIDLVGYEMEYGTDDTNRDEPGVEYQMASRLIRNIEILSGIDPTRNILIKMKTCGGDWNEGMAIHNAIDTCPNNVVILSYTHARSMSSLIFQAADKRVMMQDSYFLFHKGEVAFSGTYNQFMSFSDHYREAHKRMIEIYVNSMQKKGRFKRWSAKRIEEMLEDHMSKKEDVYLSPKETIEWGLADEIFDGDWEKLRKIPRTRKI